MNIDRQQWHEDSFNALQYYCVTKVNKSIIDPKTIAKQVRKVFGVLRSPR